MIVYLDGEWLPLRDARISVEDRGFLFGDAVFDTARHWGGGYFRLGEHLRRLAASAERLRIPCPTTGELGRIARELARRNDFDDAVLRVTVTRGAGPGARDAAGSPTVLAVLRPVAAGWLDRARVGWHVVTSAVTHPAPDPSLAQVKTPGRVHAIAARLHAVAAGADDALLISRDGYVAEGAAWNVFWRTGDELRTPALRLGILDGVTRRVVLRLARRAGMRVTQGTWRRDELDRADEAFATMTSLGLVRVHRLDGFTFPKGGHAFDRLSDLYWRRVADEVAGRG